MGGKLVIKNNIRRLRFFADEMTSELSRNTLYISLWLYYRLAALQSLAVALLRLRFAPCMPPIYPTNKCTVYFLTALQLELAEKAGASRQTIVALEAGKYTPSLEMAFRIAEVFGVPIGEVFECKKEE